jgi:hypothetical protein
MCRHRSCLPVIHKNSLSSGSIRRTKFRLLLRKVSRRWRCLTGVDSNSNGLSEFVSIDAEPNHEIVHAFRLGEARRAADEPLDPRPQIDVFALDFLCVLLSYLMLLGIEMPLVSPPAVCVKLRDAQRFQQPLKF